METEYDAVRRGIIEFMHERRWKDRLAKQGDFEQSLLEHSANCLDLMSALLPFLREPLQISDEEEQALILGIAVHDVGKERDEWQAYIRGEGSREPHIIPEYTTVAVRVLAQRLGFSGQDDARAAANLHMKSVQTAARIFAEAERAGPRIVLLHRIVDDVDNVASAAGLLAARDALGRCSLGRYVHVAYHIARVRGVSTTLLHRAAQAAFELQGWTPVLFYPTGTLYVRAGAVIPLPVTLDMVRHQLAAIIAQVMLQQRHLLPELTVGNVVKTLVPKPDLFDHRLLRDYLRVSSTRAKAKAGTSVNAANAQQYANYGALLKAGLTPAAMIKTQGKTGRALLAQVPQEHHHLLCVEPSDLRQDEAVRLLNRLGEAHPEMAVFKFLKDLVRTGLLDGPGLQTIKKTYETLFGPSTWEALTSTSTLMPARDQAFAVDFYWALPLMVLARFLDRPELDVDGHVGILGQKRRVGLLIDTLNRIAERGFAAMPDPPTVDTFAREVANLLVGDLLAPQPADGDVVHHAGEQLRYYEQAKRTIRSERETEHICPLCNHPFQKGTKALTDFIGGTSFTSRKLPYDGEETVICMVCYYERVLRQIILGRRACDLIVLMPRMSIGRDGGKVLVDKLERIKERVRGVATADTEDPDEMLRMDMTWFVARQSLASSFDEMTAEDFVRLFTYRSQEDTVQKNLRKVVSVVQDVLGSKEIEAARDFWERDFSDWTDVARAIAYRKVDDDIAQSIRETVYGLRPPIEFVAQTPNLVLAPTSNPRVPDSSALGETGDSDTKAGLKRLLVALTFALGLDCTVAILHDDEVIDDSVLEARGAAYLPPLATLRGLVVRSRSREARLRLSPAWLSQAEAPRWLRALASAVLLAGSAKYPPRNDLYDILSVRSKGALMRRIEQKGGMMTRERMQQLEAVGEVLG